MSPTPAHRSRTTRVIVFTAVALLAPLTAVLPGAGAADVVALESTYIQDPQDNLGTYASDEPATLHFRLTGPAPAAATIAYRVTDYFSQETAAGTALIPAGADTAGIPLPAELRSGHYMSTAWLESLPDDTVVGYFARLPDRQPVRGHRNRFGIDTAASLGLVPLERLDAFAAAMADAGVGYVRDRMRWFQVEPEPGTFDTALYEQVAQGFRDHGLKVLQTWHDSPTWAQAETSAPLPADLRDAYAFANHIAGLGYDALEPWSEPETKADRSTGDQMAAYVKATSIAMHDAADRPLVMLPAPVFPNDYWNLALQSDVVRYVDIWSFHGYPAPVVAGGITPFPRQSGIENQLHQLYGGAPQLWMTEAGMHTGNAAPTPPGEDLDRSQQIDQARYLVQSTVQDLAAGTDKHFWFIAPPFQQPAFSPPAPFPGGFHNFGLLSFDYQPLPAYSAQAAVTAILGRADFVGAVPGLPANARGYTFRNGGEKITVLWADSPTSVDVPAHHARVDLYNIMGNKTGGAAVEDGVAHVTASLDPIYLVADGGSAKPSRPAADDRKASSGSLTTAERIVLSQQYAPENAPPVRNFRIPPPPGGGYQLDSTTQMSVDVYNFNDTAQTVTVHGESYGGWTMHPPQQQVLVPAMGRASVPFTIAANDEVEPGVDYPVVFVATLGTGERVPPTVARMHLRTSGPAGEAPQLAPSVGDITPADGSTVVGPRVEFSAQIIDALTGIDPERIDVFVDGNHVRSHYDPATGELSASLTLKPGRHTISIHAFNNAHAPPLRPFEVVIGFIRDISAQVSVTIEVIGGG